MTFLVWWVLFGPLAALAIWGLARSKRWAPLAAVLAAKFMANRAARAERLGVQVLGGATLAGFVGVAVNEHLKTLPEPELPALDAYNAEQMAADISSRWQEAAALLAATKKEIEK